MEVLTAKFKKQPSTQSTVKECTSQTTSKISLEYHKCTVCSALFSSISRLLSYSQIATCGKAFCKHYNEAFDSKNRLHEHLRSREYIIAISSSVIKSKAPHNFSLSALTSAESVSSISIILLFSPLPKYRAVSPSLPIYETTAVTLKNHLIVADLYMRYASLKLVKSIKFSWIRSVATGFITVLSILTVKDLYKKFHEKKKLVIFIAKCVSNSSVNQNSLLRNSKCYFKLLITAKTSFSSVLKFIP